MPAQGLGRGDDMPESSDFPFPSSDALAPLGFSPHFARAFACAASPGAPFRIARVDANGCTLLGGDGEHHARVPKRLREASAPVVGDWVIARERSGELIVRRVLERTTSLTRRAAGADGRPQVLAANLDLVVICTAIDREFRLARLERWLSLVHEGGARPLVVLTKAGLVGDDELAARRREAESAAPGVEVLCVDVLANIGLDALDEALAAHDDWSRTLVFVGSSGVGKSTLVNHLCADASARTQPVSTAHGKGRHTTSHRELFEVGARRLLLIDTPGLREVGLWGDKRGLDVTFAELAELAETCRFSDCTHASEPGCAVQAAIATGQLDPRRLASWRRLADEQAATARRASEHARRSHERSFAKHVRATLEAKQRRRGGH